MTGPSLFSIDVDAHLKKAASHTFGSSSHYPVEMVRSALRRGASLVEVEISRQRIRIRDNGSGMDAAAIETLSRLLDPKQPTAVKEEAVESLQSRKGYGLLAIFASAPIKILVENVTSSGRNGLYFHENQLKKTSSFDLDRGTRITLYPHSHRDTAQEKHILEVYCHAVQMEIRLNKRLISRGPLLSPQMAHLNITGSRHIPFGAIGVPPAGDLCRLRMLDRGIPYKYVTLPPHKGFVFDAAVEYTGEITKNFLNHLAEYAVQLYQWLCRHYAETSPPMQARIEELVFSHYRLTADDSLFHLFSPFRMFRSANTLSLPQIIKQSKEYTIFAVPEGKERLRYNITGKRVLALSREQADFLINQKKLPISFLSPVLGRRKRFPKTLHDMKRLTRGIITAVSTVFTGRKVVNSYQLSPSEQDFMENLNRHLSGKGGKEGGKEGGGKGDRLVSGMLGLGGQAVMIASAGPYPFIPPKISRRSRPLRIRRRHKLVKKAVHAVHQDPENIEIFIEMIRGRF